MVKQWNPLMLTGPKCSSNLHTEDSRRGKPSGGFREVYEPRDVVCICPDLSVSNGRPLMSYERSKSVADGSSRAMLESL
jgi:hypothetical protein